MQTLEINNVTLTVGDHLRISRLAAGDTVVELPDDHPVKLIRDGNQIRVTHTYNERQVLTIPTSPEAVESIAVYVTDPVTTYRTVLQSNHEVLTRVRGLFSSFVLYGSQGLQKETTDRLSFAYRVIGSLFDPAIVKRVAENEHQVLPTLAAKDKLRPLIARVLELHYGYILKPKDGVDLMDAPIENIISGRAPDTLTDWALAVGLIDQEQAIRAKSF
jgi:hypothetical protein